MVRYFITDPYTPGGGVLQWEIFPLNDTDLKIKWSKQQDQLYYRKELTGHVLIQRNESGAYDYLMQMESYEPCRYLWLRIEEFCDNRWQEIYRGQFTTYSCEFDKDQCTVLIKAKTEDEYTQVLNDWETEYDIFNAGDAFATTLYAVNILNSSVMTQDYTNGRLLSDVLQYLAGQFGYTYKSDFFVNGDPIWGLNFKYLSIHHKADMVDPMASQLSTVCNMTFKDLMDTLNKMFDVYWFIDGVYLRIEHETFFDGLSYGAPQIGLDLTLPEFKVKKANKYKFINEEMPYREEWTWPEKVDKLNRFQDGYVQYTKDCTTDDIMKRSVTNAVTDVYGLWRWHVDYFSTDGFVLIQNEYCNPIFGCQVALPFAPGIITKYGMTVVSADIYANQNLRWRNLIRRYWRYNRIRLTGVYGETPRNLNPTLFDLPITFDSALRLKEGYPITTRLCCQDFDPYKIYTTVIGEGKIRAASERLKDSQMELTLRYE